MYFNPVFITFTVDLPTYYVQSCSRLWAVALEQVLHQQVECLNKKNKRYTQNKYEKYNKIHIFSMKIIYPVYLFMWQYVESRNRLNKVFKIINIFENIFFLLSLVQWHEILILRWTQRLHKTKNFNFFLTQGKYINTWYLSMNKLEDVV